MVRRILTLVVAIGWAGLMATEAQPLSRVTTYDAEDGVPSSHITQLLQDRCGFLWFASWNGLCRYDGYDFQTFKPTVGDGCHMPTDRIRDIGLRPDDNILCRVDEDFFLFDTRSYRFRDLTDKERQEAADSIMRYRQSHSLALTDRQGNLWTLGNGTITRTSTVQQRTRRLDIQPANEVKCLFRDSHQRYWLTTKGDAAVRVYAVADNSLLGYLDRNGRLQRQYVSFGSPVYCMYESPDGTLWLGTKPDGLFRLHQTGDSNFAIDHLDGLPNNAVYDITQDHFGRLWVATLGGGLCYTTEPQSSAPRFHTPARYPTDKGQRLRFLKTTGNGLLLAATTEGLMETRLEADASKMTFQLHQREPNRAQSISSSATMDVVEDAQGHLFVSTESGGINRIDGRNDQDGTLIFRHFNEKSHTLSTDVVLSLTTTKDGGLIAVSDHLVMLIDSLGRQRVLDARYFNADYRLSEAHPLLLNDTTLIFGLMDGAFATTTSQMFGTAYQPPLVLTSISIQGGNEDWAVEPLDSITLQPHERSLTVHFAALDFDAPERISYAFRLMPNEQWNHIGHDRSATLLDLEPGTYLLEVRSTNADGQWTDNTRRLTIIVKPTFWESAWGRLLIITLIAITIGIVAYTLLYIKRIKRKQHETLEAYLALLNKPKTPVSSQEQPQSATAMPRINAEDDIMLKRVMTFIEEHMADSDIGVGDMAAAAATSRSGLQRKLKHAMGITPQDLLHEARIKHACQLLRQTDKSIADVAYASGFTDPKYFSRCFKQSTGQSPTEYKNTL